MKFSTKKFGSIATAAVLAGTMAFMPMTALATESDTPANYGTGKQIEKTYTYGNTPLVAQTFNFDLTYANKADKIGSNETVAPTKTGDGKVSVTTPATDDDNDGSVSASTSLDDLVNEYSFSAPGSYYFTLSEENTGNPNIAKDDTTYTVRVDVVWNTDYSATTINGIAIFKNDASGKAGTAKEANAGFTNTSNSSTGKFKVSKTVSGTAANTGDYFKYTLQLTDSTQVSGNYEVKDSNTHKTVVTLSKDNDYTVDFYLKSGESVYVLGLPKDAAYKVTEGTNVVNVAANGDKSESTDDNKYEEHYQINTDGQQDGTVATGNVQDADTTVAYNNYKGFMPTTGITMNTLPFVVVATVAVAGGAALVISRRRHAGEDF